MNDKIYSLDLKDGNVPASFVIKTMEAVDKALGGIADVPHRHNYYTVIWSFTATGKHIIDFKEYPITPDHIFFVSPGQVHQVITDPHPTGLVLLFTCDFLQRNSIREDFISNLKLFRDSDETPPLPVNETLNARLRMYGDGMMEAFHSDNEWKQDTIGAYLRLFLIECNNKCTLQGDSNTQNVEVGRSLVQRFKMLVETKHQVWHQVKEYAAALNVSPNYLNEVIKAAVGRSAKDYIQNRLILEAKRMTIFTGKSSKEIGYELGFDDPSHFSKFFRNTTGQSILEFREAVII